MVDFTSLNTAATGTVFRFHSFAQNIETAHLGRLYSKALDGLDYYVVELAAKPALKNAPDWVTNNLGVNTIRSHQGLSIVVGVALAVASFVSFVIWLHPAGTTSKPPASSDLPSDGAAHQLGANSAAFSSENRDLDKAKTPNAKANLRRTHSEGDVLESQDAAKADPLAITNRAPAKPVSNVDDDGDPNDKAAQDATAASKTDQADKV